MNNLQVLLLIVGCILAAIVFIPLKYGRIPIKYAIVWYVPIAVILLFALFPRIVWFFVHLFGFQTASNFIIGLFIAILIYICLSLLIIAAGQTKKINLLIQELSILKSKEEKDFEESNHE